MPGPRNINRANDKQRQNQAAQARKKSVTRRQGMVIDPNVVSQSPAQMPQQSVAQQMPQMQVSPQQASQANLVQPQQGTPPVVVQSPQQAIPHTPAVNSPVQSGYVATAQAPVAAAPPTAYMPPSPTAKSTHQLTHSKRPQKTAKAEKQSRSLAERIQNSRSLSEILDDSADWIYDHELIVFAVYGIIFLLLGIFFNRYISFAGGLALVILGYAMSIRDSSKDTFLFYIVGLIIFAVPFMIA